jgi:2-dehydro-3-deoxyphosphooctonate aldolase (KDO 8-P synthase)
MDVANPVRVGPVEIGRGRPLALIGGPCVMEPDDLTRTIARRLVEICGALGVPLIFKASFDKANRTSKSSYRGPGWRGACGSSSGSRPRPGLPVTTDVHETHQAAPIAEVVDLLQIPPSWRGRPTCWRRRRRRAAGQRQEGAVHGPLGHGARRRQGRRGRPGRRAADRARDDLRLRPPGQRLRAIPQMQATGAPVVFDATHSVQLPGCRGRGTATAGEREMVPSWPGRPSPPAATPSSSKSTPGPDGPLGRPEALRLTTEGLLATCTTSGAIDPRH